VVWPGDEVNSYVGRSDDGPVVVLARARHAGGLEVLVGGVAAEPVWTGHTDGVSYLLHLRQETDPGEVVVIVSR
jgi:hypothetical protein